MKSMVSVNMERNVTKFILQIYVRKMNSAVKSIVIKDILFLVSILKSMENVNLVNIEYQPELLSTFQCLETRN